MDKKTREDNFYAKVGRSDYYHKQYLKRKESFLEKYKNGTYKVTGDYSEERKKYFKKQTDELTDYYIKKQLISSGFKKEDINPELIEIKRQQIILNRNIKQIQIK